MEICNNDAEILKCIKEIILDRHPIVEDRLSILYPSFREPRTPEMEIWFNFYQIEDKTITQISFLDGTLFHKESIPEVININGLISKTLICDLISYLLIDHDCFKNIYRNDTIIELSMIVDGRDENMHGISCGEINLKFDFHLHHDSNLLLKEYLKVITATFYEKLKGTSSFKKEFSNYCDFLKSEFINSSTIEELKGFIELLNSNDLCDLIFSIPNDHFVQLYNEYSAQKNIKKLTKN